MFVNVPQINVLITGLEVEVLRVEIQKASPLSIQMDVSSREKAA